MHTCSEVRTLHELNCDMQLRIPWSSHRRFLDAYYDNCHMYIHPFFVDMNQPSQDSSNFGGDSPFESCATESKFGSTLSCFLFNPFQSVPCFISQVRPQPVLDTDSTDDEKVHKLCVHMFYAMCLGKIWIFFDRTTLWIYRRIGTAWPST